LAQRLPHWSELFAKVHASSHGSQSLYRLVRYLQKLGDEQAYEAVKRVLKSIMQPERAEAFRRTMEEVLKERGREEGLARGLAKGLAKGLAEGEARGEAKGLARAVLQLLTARGVHVDEASRQRIQSCLDVATLERWHARAMSATHVSDVLDGPTR
jgi:flagellar biosynthesis/type III secretory pathway protein FliH